MKISKIVIVLLAAFVLVSFRSSNHFNKDGIVFFKGTWNEALKKAKTENKHIFLDIYATWCGPCKKLKNTTFRDSEAGEYFNKNFINVRIDGEKEEGRELVKQYQIISYPTLLIIDQNGKKLTKTTGFMKPRILVNFGRRIVP